MSVVMNGSRFHDRANDAEAPVSRRPILVTGSHRSGSTWVGRTLATAPGIGYIHEPFNLNRRLDLFRADVRYWYRYVDDASAPIFERAFSDALAFRFSWSARIRASRSVQDLREVGRNWLRYSAFRRAGFRPLVKDPLAVFASEWIAKTFDADVVVLVRHPAAFTLSVLKTGWTHSFADFLAQPQLMKDLLVPFEAEIRSYSERPRPLFDQAILLWRIIYHTVRQFHDRHPEWYVVRHTDLSLDPLQGFERMFRALHVPFTDGVRSMIAEHSAESNPVETDDLFELRRNSRKNILKWAASFSADQIAEIRERTIDVWPAYYSDRDWTAFDAL